MRSLGLDNVEAAEEGKRVAPGGYVCKITSVSDVPDKEYLKFEFDIAEGEFKGAYKRLFDALGFWAGNFIKSYKDTALRFFKQFTLVVEKSNAGYKFDERNENLLCGKYVGIVLAEEEYLSKSGELKTRLYADRFKTVEDIRNGNFIVPQLKKLEGAGAGVKKSANEPQPFAPISDDDLPF